MKQLFLALSILSFAACSTTAQNSLEPGWVLTKNGTFHALSGFTCPQRINDFQQTEAIQSHGTTNGLDVYCKLTATNGGWVTFYLNHESIRPSLNAHFEEAERAIYLVNGLDEAVDMPLTSDGQTVTELAAAYRATPYTGRLLRDDEIQDTVLWMERVGSWHVKIRGNYYRGTGTAIADASADLLEKARADLPNGVIVFESSEAPASIASQE